MSRVLARRPSVRHPLRHPFRHPLPLPHLAIPPWFPRFVLAARQRQSVLAVGPLVLLSVAFLGGLLVPFALPVVPSACTAAVLAWLGAWARTRSTLLAACLLVVAVALAGVCRAHALRLPPIVTLTPDTLRVYGRVVAGCLPDSLGQRCTLDTALHGRTDLRFTQGTCSARPGDTVDLVATVRPVIPLRNPPRIDPDTVRVLQGIRYRVDASACTVTGRGYNPRDVLRRAALATRLAVNRSLTHSLCPRSADQARALLFGDTAALDPDARDAFRASGLAHLLAVSGAHVALLMAVLGRATRGALSRVPPLALRGLAPRLATVLPLPCVGFFVLVTGESPSSVRALLTGVVSAAATLSGRRPHGPSLVAGVALAMATVSPPMVLDPGWQLSVVAAWTLAAAPRVTTVSTVPTVTPFVHGIAQVAREALAVSARVALAVSPLLAWLAGRAPAFATLANLLAAPLGEVVLLPCSLLAAVLGALAPTVVAHAFGALLTPLLDALFALPALAMRLPLASVPLPVPTPAQCLVATVALLGALASSRQGAVRWLSAGLVVVCILEIVHRAGVHPTGVLRVTALDVGQGDAIVVDLPDGTAMLVDGGGALSGGPDPGARAVVPWLSLHRRGTLSAVVLSHPHPDHAGGLSAVLHAVRPEALWDTGQGTTLGTRGAYADVLAGARAMGIPVRGPRDLCGPPRSFHGAVLQVLAPCPGPLDGDPPNDASFVIRLSLGRASVLLPGDLEHTGESRLLAHLAQDHLAPVTVLKVPHHGSRTSSTEAFLTALSPRVALVSCGHPSPFGHPHPEVLARYATHGITLLRTDLQGAVSVTLHPDGTVDW